jgi:hypothetical protein
MDYSSLIQLYFERSNALQWYWTIYVVVIGGLLAFSSIRKQPDLITGVLVTVLFSFFAYKNLGAIQDVTLQRHATVQLIRDYPISNSPEAIDIPRTRATLEPTLIVPAYEGIRNFHISCDLLTIAALWAMELRRRRAFKMIGLRCES